MKIKLLIILLIIIFSLVTANIESDIQDIKKSIENMENIIINLGHIHKKYHKVIEINLASNKTGILEYITDEYAHNIKLITIYLYSSFFLILYIIFINSNMLGLLFYNKFIK